MVVVGSFHAAVFALSQGIPAICIVSSPYYRNKFLGLAAQFGAGCVMLGLDEPGFEARFAEESEQLWRRAEEFHLPLLEAARRQIRQSREAWAQLPLLVADR
jgi:polysaccharide pyruvyl transferase WcaK-like protein